LNEYGIGMGPTSRSEASEGSLRSTNARLFVTYVSNCCCNLAFSLSENCRPFNERNGDFSPTIRHNPIDGLQITSYQTGETRLGNVSKTAYLHLELQNCGSNFLIV
jgi:hypothetical protein